MKIRAPYGAAYESDFQSGLDRLAFGLMVILVSLAIGRHHEILGQILGISFRVFAVFGPFVLFVVVVSGHFVTAFRHRLGLLLVGLTFWMLLATPLSVWRGGSVAWLRTHWLIEMILFVCVASVIPSVGKYRTVARAIGYGAMLVCLFAATFGTGARLAVGEGSLGNPNDLACYLLIGAPFWLLSFLSKTAPRWEKALTASMAVLLLVVILKTGSRGGLIALVFMCLLLWLHQPAHKKVALAAVFALVSVISWTVLPEISRARLLSTFSDNVASEDEEVSEELGKAVGSRQGRKELLIGSIQAAMSHPVFGVGPGMFPVYLGKLWNEERGSAQGWREAHNTYTQIAAEAGLPAALLFCAAVFLAIHRSRRIYRAAGRNPQLQEIQALAFCTYISLMGYALGAVFSSLHHNVQFHVLAGLVVALDKASRPYLSGSLGVTGNQAARWPVSRQVRTAPAAALRSQV